MKRQLQVGDTVVATRYLGPAAARGDEGVVYAVYGSEIVHVRFGKLAHYGCSRDQVEHYADWIATEQHEA